MRRLQALSGMTLLLVLWGCTAGTTVNPFLTLTEALGISAGGEDTEQGAAQGAATEAEFREPLTVTFRNNHTTADLNLSLVAWVNVSSIRSADQQEALINDGYVQLRRETRIGTAITLPVGTYVYNGPGTAGATSIFLPASESDDAGVVTSSTGIELISPDAILAFYQPPVSCESVAFYYTRNGEPLESVPVGGGELPPLAGSTTRGAFKTLAQVDVYQCDPFRPGLYIRIVGGIANANEYFEGEDIAFDFNEFPDANGDFCIVTIGATEAAAVTP